jgi:uncharacterized membrane protein HdeD (DUF308 family)
MVEKGGAMNQPCEKDDRHGMIIGGIIVLGLGVVFLLSNLEIIPHFWEMWPLFLVVIGVALIAGALTKKKKEQEGERQGVHDPRA